MDPLAPLLVLLALSLRGAAAVLIVTTLVGGFPRIVQLGLALLVGLWVAMLAPAPAVAGPAALLVIAAHELVVGATIGLLASLPLLAARTAGDLVSHAASVRGGPYRALFAMLAGAVFVGLDGHVALVRGLAESYRVAPDTDQVHVVAALAALIPSAITLAIPWLVTAAVVELAIGAGVRVAGRAGAYAPVAAAAPAALVMITAALVSTLAVAIATLVRGALAI
jgi:flagellar biosynthesis protein FliR